jgi:hypothetical protein
MGKPACDFTCENNVLNVSRHQEIIGHFVIGM